MKYILLIISVFLLTQKTFSTKKDSLFIALKREKNQNNIVDIYNKLSKEYKSINPDSSLFFIKKALKLSTDLNYSKGEANTCFNYGVYYKTKTNLDSSIVWYQKALNYYTACTDTMEMSRTLTVIGNVYSDKSDYLTAIKYFKQSLSYKILIKDKKGIGINLYNIANRYYYDIKNYKLGLENYIKAIEIFTEIDYKTGLASCLNSMGNLYEDWGNYELALKSYNDALKIEKDETKLVDIYNNIGSVYSKIQNYDTALIKFSKALELSKKTNYLEKEAISLKNIGVLYSDIGNTEKAEQFLKEALKISEQIQFKDLEVEILSSMGYSYLFQQQCKISLNYLLKSQEIATEIDYKDFITSNYIFLSEAYMCIGDGQKAKDFFKKYIAAQDNNNKELNDLRIKYETEKQDKEIQLLNKQQELNKADLKAKEAETANQRIIIYVFIFGLIAVLIFLFVILKQFQQKKKANIILAEQKRIVEEQKEEIEDSINYALRIQRAVFPIENDIVNITIGDYFLIFKPKYIVAGDFFWIKRVSDYLIVAVADCTGHGVPGAFMSMLGVSFLSEIIRKPEITKPSEVLNELRLYIIDALKQKGLSGEQKDGMDMTICVINVNTLECQFAGANNPLYIIHTGNLDLTTFEKLSNLEEIKGDKMPVAIYEKMHDFTNHVVNLKAGDRIYMFSDGYADQFGGEKGKKFMYKPFKRLLTETSNLSIKEQGNHLEKILSEWIEHRDFNTGVSFEQTDDITVFGLELKHSDLIQ